MTWKIDYAPSYILSGCCEREMFKMTIVLSSNAMWICLHC